MSSPLVVSVPDQRLARAIQPLPEGVELHEWDLEGAPPAPHVDLVVAPYIGGTSVLERVAAVTPLLVQGQSIGVDGIADVLPAGVRFANAATVHETATAEIALALALGVLRDLPGSVRDQDRGEWNQHWAPGLADRHAVILGAGGVGNAIADRLTPFEVEVTRVARTARDDERGRVHALSELDSLLPGASLLVVALPLADGTRRLVDAGALAALPDGAAVINVGRGPVVDTDALVAELRSGRLLAGLDVTDPEPLPADHPLWSAPGTLITPHVGGLTRAMLPRMAALVRRQIDRLLAGDEPENIVIGA
ncbi:2-hydroxyacid dehydrogenase [Mycetocola reblochoni]|uniref:D-3-phosphoglycerate dehydrogenase n=2 Tax=Mycetocola reblochoni TaxID=331618 RepID=A0A1R4ITK1_9MICO|nr:2-hydroxyacid dehydrogenase [Mycetocola reblochoni]RLP71062.1 hydroxyacid dehydrogenase [Mycetocola reblochoni]SJN23028.1 D-3-phosphoglycerate dehydrogenase [Mycetocola reblochoni REB411]